MNLEQRAARRAAHPTPEQVRFVLTDAVWHQKLREAFAIFDEDFDRLLNLAVLAWSGDPNATLKIRAGGVFLDVMPHEIKADKKIRIRDRNTDLKLRQLDTLFSLKLARALSLSTPGDVLINILLCFPYSSYFGDRITARVLLDELEITND